MTVSPPTAGEDLVRAAKRARLVQFGPAFVAAVAYVDPGNFATNFQAGAQFGYSMLWVLVAANAAAMFVQYLSAKIGLAVGLDLATLCREKFSRSVARSLWVQAELVAMATDMAEFVGAALGLNLLFGVPLVPAALLTAVLSFAILGLQRRGYRPFEMAITFLLAVVAVGFGYQLFAVGHQSAAGIAAGLLPNFMGTKSLTLAVGIVGATIMPHVIYLHSAMTAQRPTPRDTDERRMLLRALRVDCVTGLGLAGIINMVMLAVAVGIFHHVGGAYDGSLAATHAGIARYVGGIAALAFAVALLGAGLSSSGVGTYAGQIVMQGFIHRRIPLVLRRSITMAPALIVLVTGVSPDIVLVISQVVLSFGIPFALVPLVLFTCNQELMGNLVNRRVTTWIGGIIAVLLSGLNVYLLIQVLFG